MYKGCLKLNTVITIHFSSVFMLTKGFPIFCKFAIDIKIKDNIK